MPLICPATPPPSACFKTVPGGIETGAPCCDTIAFGLERTNVCAFDEFIVLVALLDPT